jgi:hypothetical protein
LYISYEGLSGNTGTSARSARILFRQKANMWQSYSTTPSVYEFLQGTGRMDGKWGADRDRGAPFREIWGGVGNKHSMALRAH